MDLSSELARSLLEAAPEPVLAVDSDGRIVFASRHVRSVFGYAPERLIGEKLEYLLAARCHDAHRQHRRRLAGCAGPGSEAATERLQLHGRHKEGAEFPIEISSTPVLGPEGTLILTILRDASAESALAHRLALARRAGYRLPAAASHELRQPLQALNLLTAAAARQAAHDSTLASIIARQREVLETLTRLLGSMLETKGRDARQGPRRVEDSSSLDDSRPGPVQGAPAAAGSVAARSDAGPPGAPRPDEDRSDAAALGLRDQRRTRG
jgi:PAS domain S-box-containing protein